MAAEVLKDLYKTEPASKAAIEKRAGYAVFNNIGMNVLLLSTARGSGLSVNNKISDGVDRPIQCTELRKRYRP